MEMLRRLAVDGTAETENLDMQSGGHDVEVTTHEVSEKGT